MRGYVEQLFSVRAIRMPASMAQHRVWSFLSRAGAFGTLHGGHPGDAAVGLTVPIMSSEDFRDALEVLENLKVQATLLIATLPTLADSEPWRAVQAGHEVAGLNLPADYRRLEACTGKQVRFWALPEGGATRGTRLALQKAGIALLPEPEARHAPGSILRVQPSELRTAVPELKRLGYRPVPVGQLRALRRGTPQDALHDLYQHVVEDRYAEREGIIDLSQRFDAILRVAPLDHAPSPLPLPAQTRTAELHVNSARLVGLASGNLTATYKALQRSLRDVAILLETHPEVQDAQAVFAVTLFHRPLERAGFTILELPPLRARWYGLGFRLLRIAYGTTRTPSEGTPKMGWMPREAFVARYGPKPADTAE